MKRASVLRKNLNSLRVGLLATKVRLVLESDTRLEALQLMDRKQEGCLLEAKNVSNQRTQIACLEAVVAEIDYIIGIDDECRRNGQ